MGWMMPCLNLAAAMATYMYLGMLFHYSNIQLEPFLTYQIKRLNDTTQTRKRFFFQTRKQNLTAKHLNS